MKKAYLPFCFLFLSLLACNFPLSAQEENKPVTRILFILDASRSMSGKWQGDRKFGIARTVLSRVLDSLKTVENTEVALRVYGHLKHYPPQDCNDTKLEVPFAPDNAERIKFALKQIVPKGTSPIAASLARAKTDFPDCENCRNIVILITDGIEECGGDLCEVSAILQKKGIILKPFIIGIGNDLHETFGCAGTYFNANDREQFVHALNIIITKVLSRTSLQVNLLDAYGNPKETNVNLTFFNRQNGRVMYNYVHTLNNKGVPDTLVVDPLNEYRIRVNTLPPVTIDSVKLTEGKHNIVAVSCPQGLFRLQLGTNAPVDFNPAVVVRRKGEQEILNVQYLNEKVRYLTGNYTAEVLCLPIIRLPDVEIEPDKLTEIKIENPGIAVFQKNARGYGSVYLLSGNGQEFVIRLNENAKNTESLYLQPGKYRVVFRSRYASQSVFTTVKEFTVSEGKTTRIRL